jgi:Terminase small subunit
MSAKNEHGLTPQQEKFAQEVAKGRPLADAYRSSYPLSKTWKPESVWPKASSMASDGKVSARVAQLQAAAADRAELDAAEILREIRRVAISDIAGIMHADGRVKLPHELDAATRAAVASFKIDEYGRIEYKFWDKNSALEKAAKIKGLYELDNKQKTDPLADVLKTLGGNVLGPGRSVLPVLSADEDDNDE